MVAVCDYSVRTDTCDPSPCMSFCYWLCEHKGVGSWVYIIGLIFGIGAGIMTWYKLYLRAKKHNNKKKDKKPFGFNDHV